MVGDVFKEIMERSQASGWDHPDEAGDGLLEGEGRRVQVECVDTITDRSGVVERSSVPNLISWVGFQCAGASWVGRLLLLLFLLLLDLPGNHGGDGLSRDGWDAFIGVWQKDILAEDFLTKSIELGLEGIEVIVETGF